MSLAGFLRCSSTRHPGLLGGSLRDTAQKGFLTGPDRGSLRGLGFRGLGPLGFTVHLLKGFFQWSWRLPVRSVAGVP